MDVNLLFYCKFCTKTTRTLKSHLHHHKVHRHLSKLIHCGLGHCLSAFRSETSLRCHVIRSHRIFITKALRIRPHHVPPFSGGKYQCPLELCGKEFHEYKTLFSHLKEHLKSRESIPCVVKDCTKTYATINSLTGHISRKHRQNMNVHELSSVPLSQQPPEIPLEDFFAPEETVTQEERKEESLVALAQFFQKLEYKHMVPASVNQVIFTEIQSLLLTMERCFLNSLSSTLQDEGYLPDTISSVLSSVSQSNELLEVCHTLRSSYMRKVFYVRHFNFVVPEKVPLENGSFFYYIPIKKTIEASFCNKSWNFGRNNVPPPNEELLRDYFDGEAYKNNPFFRENPDAIPLILYQDGFELVCPIGPAKNLKHKILGVYLAFGNLPANIRYQKDSIQLVALVKACDFNHAEVYGRIVQDLISLQESGVEVAGHGTVKAGLVFIAGDNLGSHNLAGLIESFSSAKYFCRYCLMSRKQFMRAGGETRSYPRRTEDSYNEDLRRVKVVGGQIKNHRGVKCDSPFNSIPGFHVCAPSLPPCLGHDLMEGLIAYDLKLYIQYFVRKKWFDKEILNHLIESFPYSVEEKKDRPCIIKKLEKPRLAGSAWQLFTLLRLFPLIIFNYIKDPNDKVWKLLLLLRSIVLTSVAPEMHKSHLPSLQCMNDEYLMLRRKLFAKRLRPKHHYGYHMAMNFLYFGALIKAWTLRFESKHSFFIRSWKSSNNSINLLQTLSYKHEFLQSWVRSGGSSFCTVESGERVPYHHVMYSESIQKAVEKCVHSFSQFDEANTLSVKGTPYRKGEVLILRQVSGSNDLMVGIIHLMLIGPDNDVTFVVKLCKAEFVYMYGCYKMQVPGNFECIRQVDLPAFYPLHQYVRDTGTYICLRHELVNSVCDPLY